jgi:hypothetical protein
VTGRDRVRIRNRFPRFFLSIDLCIHKNMGAAITILKINRTPTHQDIFCITIQAFFDGFHHYSQYIDYFSMNCVSQLAKTGWWCLIHQCMWQK